MEQDKVAMMDESAKKENQNPAFAEFDLEELNPGIWVDYPRGGRVLLRVCNGQVLDEIYKQTRKQTKVPQIVKGRPILFTREDINQELENELTWDYCIMDWEGFQMKGEEIPCTKANKIKFMQGSVEFSNFCAEQFMIISGMREILMADAEKNL